MPITVMNHVTLDGVMQAPGRADEDTRGGFAHGGWAEAGNDEVMGSYLGERMAAGGGAHIFGRRTYDDLLSFWNSQPDNPFASALNNIPKYVASTTLAEPLPWPNSSLLEGGPAEAVAALTESQSGTGFTIMGSSTLIHQLMAHDLIDEWLLMIHPLVLGSGIQLFPADATPTRLEMVDSVTTTTGVVIASYRTAGKPGETCALGQHGSTSKLADIPGFSSLRRADTICRP
jgi:dihydrofolate reductase